MRNTMSGRAAASLLALALLAGCGDAPFVPTETIEAGSMTFEYSGAVAGSFAADGAPEVDQKARPRPGTWAVAGESHFSAEKVIITGYSSNAQGQPVLMAFSVPRVTGPATIDIDTNCVTPECSSLLLLVGSDPRDPHGTSALTCDMQRGTLQVTSAGADRMAGTFSGEGFCVANVRTDPFIRFTVRDGTFDVDVVEGLRIGVNVE
ncbi:MAG TPA: hypothetical protein VGB24_01585 [Longimicrobium sp.]|jgi:hypothetical protein|uniref:hypothetical protein n=1 Tax=Longimicrobium sp. TaxID=2029185 RepID=UPI002EDAAF86